MKSLTNAAEFRAAWQKGRVCLHPTDSIPGVSFDPRSARGFSAFLQLKPRSLEKGFVALVGSVEQAVKFWQPLPGTWLRVLQQIWPAPLSIVWQARASVPRVLTGLKGDTLCLRYPAVPRQSWFQKLLEDLPCPMPSTSVNSPGFCPIVDWQAASLWVQEQSLTSYIPGQEAMPCLGQVSTVIEIVDGGSFRTLRKGAFALDPLLLSFQEKSGDV